MAAEPATIWTTHEDMKTRELTSLPRRVSSIKNEFTSSTFVGVQSRFRRKYYKKVKTHQTAICLVLIIILMLLAVVVMALFRITSSSDVCYSPECLRTSSTFLENMDFNADPCEDFFQFTCGNFENEHPRPDYQTSHDWFSEKQSKILREIKKKLQAAPQPSGGNVGEPAPVTKARKLFTSCLNISATNMLRFRPLFKLLKQYHLPKIPTLISDPEAVDFKYDWIQSIVKIKRSLGADKLIGFEIFADPKNRSEQFLALGSPDSETDLPLIDDVLAKRLKRFRRKWSITGSEKDDESDEMVGESEGGGMMLAYGLYMKEVIMAIVKEENPTFGSEQNMETVFNAIKVTIDISREIYTFIEVAENASKAEDINGTLSDLLYMKISELQRIIDDDLSPTEEDVPVFETYLTQMLSGIPEAQFEMDSDLILTSHADILYLKLALKMIREAAPMHLEMFVWWSVIEDLILYTTSSMRQLYYGYLKTITGVDGSTSRSEYCTASVNKLMGFAVSYLVVEENFLTETKPKVERMVENIRRTFNNLVNHASWMDWETKENTLKKSQKMKSLIGFPEWVINKTRLELYYEGIEINSDTWMENIVELLSWTFMDKLTNWRMKKDFDWATSPTNVNAFHTFQANAITIPLAILQFPFYQLGLESLNYGSIGTILAHELTHGFDDIGRHFDEEGNKNYWWTNTTVTQFISRAECFKKQYSEYFLPEIGDYINGELTLGENIADNGGLREAYYAYNYYTHSTGKEPKLPGFESYTHEQLFFMSFGNLWCETMTTTGLKYALEDSHCPGKIRVLGVLSNFKEFHNAFHCHPGQKFHRTDDEKCIIW